MTTQLFSGSSWETVRNKGAGAHVKRGSSPAEGEVKIQSESEAAGARKRLRLGTGSRAKCVQVICPQEVNYEDYGQQRMYKWSENE